jgi:hypothetical protein
MSALPKLFHQDKSNSMGCRLKKPSLINCQALYLQNCKKRKTPLFLRTVGFQASVKVHYFMLPSLESLARILGLVVRHVPGY